MAKQILNRHRARGRGPFQADLHVLEFGEVLSNRRADIELALFEYHDGDRGDRLQYGRNAEDGIVLRRRMRAPVLKAEGIERGNFFIARDKQHGTGNAAGCNVRFDLSADAFEALG